MLRDKVNLAEKFSAFQDYRHPRIVGEVNDCHIKVVKLQGEFVWHQHEHEDELFLVVQGELVMRLRDREVTIRPGEFFVVPRGVEHCPVAGQETHIVLIEPKSTRNTGALVHDYTVEAPEWI
ncbi:MAG: cupin domain-containing protein [Acidobacteria bacterium]|jgi:mannose-6-phosphate isomerase-like protein (cupin superfamily)|nr:cupin domain-containing protein [Acidobacteriota bacterium]